MKQTVYRKILSIVLLIGGLLGVLVFQNGLIIIMMLITRTGLNAVRNYEPHFMSMFYIVYSVIGIVIICVFRYIRQRFSFLQPVSGKNGAFFEREITIPGLIVLGIALQLLSTGLLNIIYYFAADTDVFRNYNELMKNIDGSMTKSILIYTVLLAPVFEELIFRGLIMDFARYGFSVTASIIITAVSFGIFHGNIVQFCYAVPIGLVLAYVRMCRERLSDSIILHIIINLSSVTVMPVLSKVIAQVTGEMASYGMFLILGVILLAMWFLKGGWKKTEKFPIER